MECFEQSIVTDETHYKNIERFADAIFKLGLIVRWRNLPDELSVRRIIPKYENKWSVMKATLHFYQCDLKRGFRLMLRGVN